MNKQQIRCGCEPSGVSIKDIEYVQILSNSMPSIFDADVKGDVINQGSDGSCVSQCLYEMVRYNKEKWNHSDCSINREWVYDRRQNKAVEGMTPREGMEILRRNDIVSLYARIPSVMAMKSALMSCGPILIALPVYNATNQFWLGEGRPVGYHAVTVTAFSECELTFKNTWGLDWGSFGYGCLPISDFDKIVESWVILE